MFVNTLAFILIHFCWQPVDENMLIHLLSQVCPGREGPIFFGDSDTRYVLSYTFHLKDTKARGGRRLYSIIVVSTDL